MEPVTWITLLVKYWWIILIFALCAYIGVLKADILLLDTLIASKTQALVAKTEELKTLKTKIDTQNKAVDDMAQKGKEQALRLDAAIKKVNAMKPATQVIIREIYTDSSKDTNQLLLNALND